jgi:hypothetical protein
MGWTATLPAPDGDHMEVGSPELAVECSSATKWSLPLLHDHPAPTPYPTVTSIDLEADAPADPRRDHGRRML